MKMNNFLNRLLVIGFGFFLVFSLVQCGSSDSAENAANEAEAMANDAMNDAGDAVDAANDAMDNAEGEVNAASPEMEKMATLSADLGIDEGSWGYDVLEYMESGEGEKEFTLDQIPYEGEELTAEGEKQLDDLASLLKQYPDLNVIVKGHSRSGDNAVEKTANKASSKARALWVQGKLGNRGVDGKQMQAKGIGGGEPLDGVDVKDMSQRRITIAFTK